MLNANIGYHDASSTRTTVYTGICITLVFVATAFINLRLPIAANGGLIHLGNVPLFISAIIFGRKIGALAGALGMALFDIMGGWFLWAPFTFVVAGSIGYAVGTISYRKSYLGSYIMAISVALTLKIIGYYIAEALIYSNWSIPMLSIPGNIVQIAVAGAITYPIVIFLLKAN